MATITAGVGNYKGKLALPYVTPAIMAADTIVNNLCDVRTNVVGTAVLRKWDGATLRARTCGFTGQSGATLGEVTLATTKLEIKLELCQKDLAATWEADLMRNSKLAPQDTKQAFLQYIAKAAAQDIEKNMWRGNYNSTDGTTSGGTSTSAFAGFNSLIVAASPTYEQALTGATDSSNILARLNACVASAPGEIAMDENTYLYMSPAMKAVYYQGMAATYGAVLGDAIDSYAGYKIVTPRGMPDDTFILSPWNNFVFGTDLTGTNVDVAANVVDLNETTLEDVVRGMVALTAGCAVVDFDSLSVSRRTS